MKISLSNGIGLYGGFAGLKAVARKISFKMNIGEEMVLSKNQL